MVDVLGIGKATPPDARSYESEVVDGSGVRRWRAGVLDGKIAFGADGVCGV